jgi:hypothetical protein
VAYSGGIADKQGNIYEAKWAVRQLLDVLRGAAEAIRFESIAGEDQGFELRVERNGATEHHQAKRRTSAGNWTLRRLETEGVLASFQEKLAPSPSNRCVFISQYPAIQLDGLIEKASKAQSGSELRGSLGDQADADLAEICRIWSVDAETGFEWLRRVEAWVLPEKQIDALIDSQVRIAVHEDPGVAFSVLRAFLEARMNRRLTTDDVRRELREEGRLSFKDWALDTTLAEQLEQATEEYLASYGSFGFSNVVISRREARQAFEDLSSSVTTHPLAIRVGRG